LATTFRPPSGTFRRYLAQEPEGDAPPLAIAHWRLGQVLDKEGKTQAAIAEFETALWLSPGLKVAETDLARLKGKA
jgi:hypothetical protein